MFVELTFPSKVAEQKNQSNQLNGLKLCFVPVLVWKVLGAKTGHVGLNYDDNLKAARVRKVCLIQNIIQTVGFKP